MTWQDAVFAIGTLTFSLALIPSIKSKNKPHLYTSVMTAVVLVAFSATYFSLDLIFSCITALINASLWSVLTWQKYSQK